MFNEISEKMAHHELNNKPETKIVIIMQSSSEQTAARKKNKTRFGAINSTATTNRLWMSLQVA